MTVIIPIATAGICVSLMIFLMRRNNAIYRCRMDLIDQILRVSEAEAAAGINGLWRWDEFEKISYDQMFYNFWVPVSRYKKQIAASCLGYKYLQDVGGGEPSRETIQIFFSEEDEGFIAIMPDDASFKGCSAFGKTRADALREVEIAIELYKESRAGMQ